MTIISRPYTKEDLQACSNLLLESYCATHDLQNWSLRHWEGQVYHRPDFQTFPEHAIHVWQDQEKLVAFAHAEYTGSVFLQVMPQYRRIEANMLEWAEHHLAVSKDNHLVLETWAYKTDKYREDLLIRSGFEQSQFFMLNRCRENKETIPSVSLPQSYQIRGMQRTFSDCKQMADLLNAAFKRDFHKPEEYANFQTAPHYRPELDLVAVTRDGTIVANAQLTIVQENAYAEFEPVCTHPEHQGRGLASALMAEGLRLLELQAIRKAYVDAAGDNPTSNALYEKMGFTETKQLYLWKKVW